MTTNNNNDIAQIIVEDGFFKGFASSLDRVGKSATGFARDVDMAVAGINGARLYKQVYRKILIDWKHFSSALGADAKTEALPTDENLLKFVFKYYKSDASEILAMIKADFSDYDQEKEGPEIESPEDARQRTVSKALRRHDQMFEVAEEFFKALAREIASDPDLASLFLQAKGNPPGKGSSGDMMGYGSTPPSYHATNANPTKAPSGTEVNMDTFKKSLADLGVRKSLLSDLSALRGKDPADIQAKINSYIDYDDAIKIVAAMLSSIKR